MKHTRFLSILSLLICFVVEGYPQAGDAGSSGLSFLKLGVGARPSGLGEAYTAVSADAYSTFWNPAGLAKLQQTQAVFTHSEWVEDISSDFVAFASKAFGGTIGFSFYTNSVDGIERRDIPSEQPLGAIDANDVMAAFSYGRAFGQKFSAGFTAKYLYEKIFIESVSGYAFDFGLDFKPFDSPLQLGAVVQNIGSMGTLLDESIRLPTTIKAGLAYRMDVEAVEGALLLAADGVKVRDTDIRANFGVEFLLKQKFAFRAGYQTGFDEKAFGGGFGLNLTRYHFDYGYTPFTSGFGDTHRFSFGLDL